MVTKTVLIDIERFDKTRVVIADFVVGDETGIIKMRLRNELQIDLLSEGQTIIIRNCKIPILNSHMRMIVDAFGKIEISKNKEIKEVNMEKDLSSIKYDMKQNYSNNNNHGYGGKNRNNNYNQNNNDNSNYQNKRQNYNDNSSVNTFNTGYGFY